MLREPKVFIKTAQMCSFAAGSFYVMAIMDFLNKNYYSFMITAVITGLLLFIARNLSTKDTV